MELKKAESESWGTPYDIFNFCEQRYGKHDLDAAAESNWSMVSEYLTKEDDALDPDTQWNGNNIWINPPYNSKMITKFVQRVIKEVNENNKCATMLLPAKTDQLWFQELCYNNATELIFLKGRLKFRSKDPSIKENNAGFPCIIVRFDKKERDNKILTEFYIKHFDNFL